MYICLANNVDVEILSSKHHVWDDSFYYNNIVLCEMKLYNDGLLEMVPGFSTVCKEAIVTNSNQTEQSTRNRSQSTTGVVSGGELGIDAITHTEPINKSVFMDNNTIISAFRNGFRLETYTVRTPDGHVYEYSLENKNSLPIVDASVSHPLLTIPFTSPSSNPIKPEVAVGVAGGNNSHVNKHGADLSKWKQDPPEASADYTCTIYGEIVSASGFDGSKLMVNYEIVYPNGSSGNSNWTLRKGNLCDGVVVKDLLTTYNNYSNNQTMSNTFIGLKANPSGSVMNPLQLSSLVANKESEGCLVGSTHVGINTQAPGRYVLGSGDTLKPSSKTYDNYDYYHDYFHMLHHRMDEFTRVLLGLTFFAMSCLSVILGISNPLWVFIVLVILFVLGWGMPGGGDILVMNDIHQKQNYYHDAANLRNKVYQINCSNTITEPVTHLNHLINVSFDVSESALQKAISAQLKQTSDANKKQNHPAVHSSKNPPMFESGANSPYILFEVYSIGWFKRYHLEGYGYCPISLTDSLTTNVPTWRPIGSLTSRLYDFYLGSGSKLFNNKFVSK